MSSLLSWYLYSLAIPTNSIISSDHHGVRKFRTNEEEVVQISERDVSQEQGENCPILFRENIENLYHTSTLQIYLISLKDDELKIGEDMLYGTQYQTHYPSVHSPEIIRGKCSKNSQYIKK